MCWVWRGRQKALIRVWVCRNRQQQAFLLNIRAKQLRQRGGRECPPPPPSAATTSAHCRLQSEAAPPPPPPTSIFIRRTASGSASGRIQAKHRRKKPGSAAWQSCGQRDTGGGSSRGGGWLRQSKGWRRGGGREVERVQRAAVGMTQHTNPRWPQFPSHPPTNRVHSPCTPPRTLPGVSMTRHLSHTVLQNSASASQVASFSQRLQCWLVGCNGTVGCGQ